MSLLGMNPMAAFPIMMGSCAFQMPAGSLRFVARRRYSARAAIGLAIGGIPGVLLAAYVVNSRFDRHHQVGAGEPLPHAADGLAKGRRVHEERGDVLEHDPLAGEVGDVSDVRTKVHRGSLVRAVVTGRPALAGTGDTAPVAGKLSGNVSATGAGPDWPSLRQSLVGAGRFDIAEGAVVGVNIPELVLERITGLPGLSMLLPSRLRADFPVLFAAEDTIVVEGQSITGRRS